jgi:hypothetical protein
MPLTSPLPIELDAEDFRRLGVRPHECRLEVIRRAATRSARALAEQQLDAPSEQVGLQLSRVTTSAYRLLDPRLRRDSSQRAHVGRILPVTLTFAAQTSLDRDAPATAPTAPFQNDSTGNAAPIEASEPESSAKSDWPINLIVDGSDQTARGETVSVRRSGSKRSQRQLGWTLLMVASLVVGSILAFAALRGDVGGPTVPDGLASAGSRPQPSQLGSTPRTAPQQPVSSDPEASPRRSSAEPAATIGDADADADADVDVDVDSSTPPLAPSLSDSKPRSPEQQEVIPQEPQLSNHVAGEELVADPSGSGTFLPDPFASLATTEGSPTSSGDDRMKPGPPSPDENSTVKRSEPPRPPETRSMPDDAAVRASREQLVSLIPELAHAVAPKDVPERIAAIESIERELSVGSVDYWAARMEVARLAWLVEDAAQVSRRLANLTEAYQVPALLPLSESFIGACNLATLPDTHQHLIDQGWSVADRLLTDRSFERCLGVLAAMEPSIETLEFENQRVALQQMLLAAEQMDRLATAERRMLDDAGRIDDEKADGKILGRFYCLMLRDWEAGLRWLVQSSNPRIASVARKEFELGDDATADDRIHLAQRWMADASRSSGRAADSMRLHAIELMRRAVAETSGLKKLETERKIDEALELVPVYLRELPSAETTTTPTSASLQTSKTGNSKIGLSGRLNVDGQDAGVQLDYRLGVALTQSVLDTISQELNRNLGPLTISLVGEFQLDEPTVVLVFVTQPQSVNQELEVDGRVIDFAPSKRSAQVSLQPGKHRIDWSIQAASLSSPASLRLQEWNTVRAIKVVQPAASPELRTTLTVAMVSGEL